MQPSVVFDGREYSLYSEPSGWRLRSQATARKFNFRTGTTRLAEAKRRAREWLAKESTNPLRSRRGGGSLARLAEIYEATPKRTKANVAADNVSRLRGVVRVTLGKEKNLLDVTCNEIGPEFWQRYQRAKLGKDFDLVTRRAENIKINAAVRAARCLFLPQLLRCYRAEGLTVREDAGQAVMLPEPYLPPSAVDDKALVRAWAKLEKKHPLWLVIGLARFAGLRREEIACARAEWIDTTGGAVRIVMRDRPAEQWWTKTGKPYSAQVIHPGLAKRLAAFAKSAPDALIVPVPLPGAERDRWFERAPQDWLRSFVTEGKRLHRLRGLYADHIAAITSDAVTARLAGVKAARNNLGHTNSATTERHYLSR